MFTESFPRRHLCRGGWKVVLRGGLWRACAESIYDFYSYVDHFVDEDFRIHFIHFH